VASEACIYGIIESVSGSEGRFSKRREWRFDATVDAPGSARAAVREFARLSIEDQSAVDAMLLCVSEAVTNVVLHAYPEGTVSRSVELEACCFCDHLDLVVRDHGIGMAPRPHSPGFGVGLPLISQVAHEARIATPAAGGTEITMRFNL
jgi:anti-sigma regulatory factor (Ser/Thr protein kinase)